MKLINLAVSLFVFVVSTSSIALERRQLPATIKLIEEQNSGGPYMDFSGGPVVHELVKALGVELEIIECPWVRCLKILEAGEADIVDHVFFTKERSTYLSYMNSPYVERDYDFRFYALRTHNLWVNKFEDLYDVSIAVINGDSYFPRFDEARELRRFEALSHVQAIQMVLNGRIDTLIATTALTPEVIAEVDSDNQLIELPYKASHQRGVYIALAKRSPWHAHFDLVNTLHEQVLAEQVR